MTINKLTWILGEWFHDHIWSTLTLSFQLGRYHSQQRSISRESLVSFCSVSAYEGEIPHGSGQQGSNTHKDKLTQNTKWRHRPNMVLTIYGQQYGPASVGGLLPEGSFAYGLLSEYRVRTTVNWAALTWPLWLTHMCANVYAYTPCF